MFNLYKIMEICTWLFIAIGITSGTAFLGLIFLFAAIT